MVQSVEFHCATAALNKLEDDIIHQCHYGRALLLIFGPPGSGRTHFAERLRAQLSRSLPTALVEAHPLLSDEQLDADALTQLGLHQLAVGHLDLNVAVSRAPAGRRVLIIDNAHDLHLSILRSLVHIAAAEREREDPRLLVVMLGDDMLEAALAEFEFGGLVAQDLHRVAMPALSLDDAQRMATAWAATLGVAEPDKQHVRDLFLRGAALPGPFLETLAMQTDHHDQNDYNHNEERDEQGDETLMSDVRHGSDDEEAPRHVNWLMTPLILLGVLVLALLLLYQTEISAWISGKPAASTVEAARTDLAITPENVNPETSVAGDAGIEVISTQAGTTTNETIPPPTTPQTETAAVANEAVATVPQATTLPPVVEAKTTTETAPVKIDTPKPESDKADNTPKPSSNSDRFSADEQALLAMNQHHFVVQIVALSDEKAVKAFSQQNHLKKVRMYRANRNGRTLYFLVQPEYADHAAAEKARDALPEAVRKHKPWVKQLGVIQQEIRGVKGK